MTPQFEISLRHCLDQLGKKGWATPLMQLEKKFQLIPDNEIAFRDELIDLLVALNAAKQQDADLPLLHIMAIRLAKCDAWTFRFSKSYAHGKTFLNPLTANLVDFTLPIEVSQSNSAFPAEDIIKRWVRDNLA